MQDSSKNQGTVASVNAKNYFEIDLGHRVIKARKWKGKERKDFKKAVLEDDVEKATKEILISRCLEERTALSSAELKYVLIQIRKQSLGTEFDFEYVCECSYKNKLKLTLDDVSVLEYEPWEKIEVKDSTYEFQNIQNAEYYNKNQDVLDDVKEIAFYTKSINDDESMSFQEVQDFYDNLDIDEFDEVFDKFSKMYCSINDVHEVKCKECKVKKEFEFDEIPGFIPDSWLK